MDNEERDSTENNKDYEPFSFPEELDDDSLTLSLSLPTRHTRTPSPPPPTLPKPLQNPLSSPSYQHFLSISAVDHSISTSSAAPTTSTTINADPSTSKSFITLPKPNPSRKFSTRRNPTQAPRGGKTEIIPIPYPWATNRRATVHNREYLRSNGIHTISGEVQCKRCERKYEIEFDLESKFKEVATFIAANKSKMHDRAPKEWMNPLLPTCKYCEQVNSVKPIIADKKKKINWLFLLLGQMLGCCTLEQLKYFCKHTKNHRTGAKDRVLYLTYLSLCKQLLDAGGLFDH